MMVLLLTSALRTLVTGLIVGGAFRLLHLQHPVFRKAVWACVLLTGFAMPLLQARSMLIRLPLFQWESPSIPETFSSKITVFSGAFSPSARNLSSAVSHSHATWPVNALHTVATLAYLLIAALFLLRIAAGFTTAWRVLLRSEPLEVESGHSVRISDEICAPWTFGSSILLPAEAQEWSKEQLALVLAHESSHVRQGDFYLQLAARIYAAVFWFSPFGWWLMRECERLGEQTSDRAAIAVANDSQRYADLLLRFSTDSSLPAVCMARRSEVCARIEAILAPDSLNLLFQRPLRAAACTALVVLVSVSAGTFTLGAQSAAEAGELAKPTVPFQTFDVISVKPASTTTNNMSIQFDGASLNATHVDMTNLLMNAYGIRPGLIMGLPKWADKDRWDIAAKITDPNPTFKDRDLPRAESEAIWRANMQTILAGKFHIKAHYETTVAPVYDLVVVKDGPRFPVSQAPQSKEMMVVNTGKLEATHIAMKDLCANLASEVERNIVDKTGLTGVYDMKLTWTPEVQANTAKDSGIANPPPDLYTALQEQLGLKLVPAKGPVRKLVIDSIELPAAN